MIVQVKAMQKRKLLELCCNFHLSLNDDIESTGVDSACDFKSVYTTDRWCLNRMNIFTAIHPSLHPSFTAIP